MNQVFVLLFSAFLFISLSSIAYFILPKYRPFKLAVGIVAYSILSVAIVLPFTDFLTKYLNDHFVKIRFSHNDMILMFEITVGCFAIWLMNCIVIIVTHTVYKDEKHNKSLEF
ncbi:MAG: hypothetical protein K0S09_1896 [Sphingobacteriaceae bacterium]|jgi:hypothetical protein|nr:hypothetical protein [Sphingobacteriaceae bacterium]